MHYAYHLASLYFMFLFYSSSGSLGGGQVCRPHFHTPYPWSLSDSKPVVPAHSSWISPFSKSLSHGSATTPLSVHPASSINTNCTNSQLFSFPPTPPKDTTPEIGNNNTNNNNTEYSPENKPKDDMGSLGSPTHPMATYPYMSSMGGPDYNSALFHSASVFKAASLARARSKGRSSSGRKQFHLLINNTVSYLKFRNQKKIDPNNSLKHLKITCFSHRNTAINNDFPIYVSFSFISITFYV